MNEGVFKGQSEEEERDWGAVACQRLPGRGRPQLNLYRTSRKCQVAHKARPTGRPVEFSN